MACTLLSIRDLKTALLHWIDQYNLTEGKLPFALRAFSILTEGSLVLQGAICVPVVAWLFLVQPISLRTMHDDEEEAHTGTGIICYFLCSRCCLSAHLPCMIVMKIEYTQMQASSFSCPS